MVYFKVKFMSVRICEESELENVKEDILRNIDEKLLETVKEFFEKKVLSYDVVEEIFNNEILEEIDELTTTVPNITENEYANKFLYMLQLSKHYKDEIVLKMAP